MARGLQVFPNLTPVGPSVHLDSQDGFDPQDGGLVHLSWSPGMGFCLIDAVPNFRGPLYLLIYLSELPKNSLGRLGFGGFGFEPETVLAELIPVSLTSDEQSQVLYLVRIPSER